MSESTYVTQEQFETTLNRIDALENENKDLRDELADERQKRKQLKQSHEVTQQSLWSLEDVVLGDYDTTHPRFEEQSIVDQVDDVEEKINTVEDDLTDVTPGVNGGETHLHDTLLAETPLEQVCGLTDDEAKEYLWENQYRARNIAMDAPQIGKKTPKGYVISSGQLRNEITVMKGETANDNDVKRVWEFLEDLGKENVRVIDHRGSKKVVIDKQFARQLGRQSYAPEECLVVEKKQSWRQILGLHTSSNGSTQASTAV